MTWDKVRISSVLAGCFHGLQHSFNTASRAKSSRGTPLKGKDLTGKMKGNRLNMAANVGTFVTSRQQLNVQRTLMQQNAIRAEYAAAQLAQMRHEQFTEEY
ncbi:hypothetical protein ACVWYS_000335 [Arthrobacter sp. TE12231]